MKGCPENQNKDSEAGRPECFWDVVGIIMSSITTVTNINLKLGMSFLPAMS